MAELQQEFSKLNSEVKDLDEVDRRAASHKKFADYKFKVGMYGSRLYDEEQIQEVSDLDREEAVVGTSGIIYTNSETKDGYCALMMKDKSEYSRFKLLMQRLEAAEKINKNDKEKEKYIKILLGEPVDEVSA
jgi:hypothetical protein